MKLIKQSKLFFKEGNSDKVYEVEICELSSTEYIVNFRYGRRGSALKEGTKTPAAVSLEKAEDLFFQLENEKRKKGYQTETEMFMELPSLDSVVEPGTAKGAILQRLQDAVEGKKSFKTEWKTSRVIWRAGCLQMQETIPFIIKLTTKGDELQTYAGLWALTQLKAVQGGPVFSAIADNIKQKYYLRNMAVEGLLTITEGEAANKLQLQLLEKLPAEIRYAIDTDNNNALSGLLTEYSQQSKVHFFTNFYLLCKVRPTLLPVLHEVLKTWAFRPPYFKLIRSIYKLAQARKDHTTLALLSYRFEKEKSMFSRSPYATESRDYRQFIVELNKSVKINSELRSDESKIAFSSSTKQYFRKNAVEFLKNSGRDSDAKTYLKLAVSTLLQYSENDYTKAEERPVYDYGMYDYQKKVYRHTLINYPECSDAFLLSTILFGNDAVRKLQPSLKYILGKRTVTTSKGYFNFNDIKETAAPPPQQSDKPAGNSADSSLLGTAVNVFKNIFGGSKQPEKKEQPVSLKKTNTATSSSSRLELFPEHWDAMPEAYVQLLMQAKMNLIHRFAYNNLKVHKDVDTICCRFDENALLRLLDSCFELPNQLGFETLKKREDEFSKQPAFIAKVLNSNSKRAQNWVRDLVTYNAGFYLNELDFITALIFNTQQDNEQWITELLQKTTFTEERQQALAGKVIAELLHLENTEKNNALAINAVKRLSIIALPQLDRIGWNIVEQLILSPLTANMLLASNILISKSRKTNPTEIPVELIDLFLQNDIQEVRQNGITLLNQYPDNFLIENINFVLNQAGNVHKDVVEAILHILRKLVAGNPSVGDTAIHYLAYALIRKEKFEGAHALINAFVTNDLKPYWNTGLQPRDVTKLIHAQYRNSQLTAYEILKGYNRINDFTLGQIISFGNHEILALRQWCWNYFKQNIARIRYERDKALGLLDAKWDDTRAYAFHFFRTEFTEADWDADTLISIVDSIRPDVEAFGKELITKYFKPENAQAYLNKLSEHPSVNVQAFVTNYLSLYAADKPDVLKRLDFYFRSVLTRVNKARIAKDRIFGFLHQEALKSVGAAEVIAPIIDDVSAQSTIQDKATCIHMLTEIKQRYPHLDMHLAIVKS